MSDEEKILRLNIYTFAAADAVSHAMDEVSKPHFMPDPIRSTQLHGFPRFCFIDKNGEFYVKKAELDDYEIFSIKFPFIKHSVVVYLDFLYALNDFSKEVIDRYLTPKVVQSRINILESVLNWWNGIASEDDMKVVGMPLDPFQANEFAIMLEDAENLDKKRWFHHSTAHYFERDKVERQYLKQMKKVAEKLCEYQNRPEDMMYYEK